MGLVFRGAVVVMMGRVLESLKRGNCLQLGIGDHKIATRLFHEVCGVFVFERLPRRWIFGGTLLLRLEAILVLDALRGTLASFHFFKS